MDPELKEELEADQRRGQEIRPFLENAIVRAVFDGLELSYYEAWKQAPTPADREKLHATVSAFDDLRHTLAGIVERGALATQQLEQGTAP